MELLDKDGLTETEYLAGYRQGDYPRPSVTADMAVFREGERGMELLLIRRGGHPFLGKWALPGGFSEPGETVDETAARELREETNLEGLPLTPFGFFSTPGRDVRAWTMSEGFAAILPADSPEPVAGDDARETGWFTVDSRWESGVLTLSFDGPEQFEARLTRDGAYAFSILDTGGLAFDHAHIIARAMERMGLLQPESVDYDTLNAQLASLVEGVPHPLANLSNAAALLWDSLDGINWAGFYLMEGEKLVLGPFMGKPACIEIPLTKGVCGAAARTDTTELVPDVHAFPGHIACDSASRSEIVVPLHKDGKVVAVLDIDSPLLHRFTEEDRAGLETFARILEKAL
jgi:GAF domain-containing protein